MESSGHDIYLRYVSPKGNTYRQHRVWDGERFIRATQAVQAQEGVVVEPATKEEYRAANWKKHG